MQEQYTKGIFAVNFLAFLFKIFLHSLNLYKYTHLMFDSSSKLG